MPKHLDVYLLILNRSAGLIGQQRSTTVAPNHGKAQRQTGGVGRLGDVDQLVIDRRTWSQLGGLALEDFRTTDGKCLGESVRNDFTNDVLACYQVVESVSSAFVKVGSWIVPPGDGSRFVTIGPAIVI